MPDAGESNDDRNSGFFKPLDNSELLKIREQVRDTINERYLLATERFSDYSHKERLSALANSKDYGSTYVRTLFLLNGGPSLHC